VWWVGTTHSLTLHRRNNLVLDLLLLDRLAEARQLLDQNWTTASERLANLTPRILILAYISARLESQPGDLFLGQVKTLLTGSELPIAPGIAVPWDLGYFIDLLRFRLPDGAAEFLTAILAALNDRANVPALEAFSDWRDQPPLSLDAPGPTE
jgi:hypothetical protein